MLGSVGQTSLETVRLNVVPALPAEMQRYGFESINPRASAVAVCLRQPMPGTAIEVALTRRARGLRNYPGNIVLPGGRVDILDTSLTETALRELKEEVGLVPSQVIGELTPLVTLDFRFVVTPVVCLAKPNAVLAVKNREEVASTRWVGLKEMVSRGHPYFESIRPPTQIFLIETLARLWPIEFQESSPEEWFGLHNTLAYMAHQWETYTRLTELYQGWGHSIRKTKKTARARKAFERLAGEQKQRIEFLKLFFPHHDPRRYLTETHPDEHARLFNALGVDLDVRTSAWGTAQWDKLCQGLFLMHCRTVERCLGLRRVLHRDISFTFPTLFWRANQFWAALLRDSFLTALSMYRLCPELRPPEARAALFRAEASVIKG